MNKKDSKKPKQAINWAASEFCDFDGGDKRIKERLIKIAQTLAEKPQSSINQACEDWSETKAAYRFFQNEDVNDQEILHSHIKKTNERAKKHKVILAIQDTSYFIYTNHKKTKGLGMISKSTHKTGKNPVGLIMHTSFAVTSQGVPLGLLDQKIVARSEMSDAERIDRKSSRKQISIEDKESMRWLNAISSDDVQMVTLSDREGDFYEYFECGNRIKTSLLVRACQTEADSRLWSAIESTPSIGIIEVKVPAKDEKPGRTALLETRIGSFTMNPPARLPRHKTKVLPDLILHAVHVKELSPPLGQEPLEWMLLTDLAVTNFEEAQEKVSWYCLRWRIEVFHKVLKSGFKVEDCRLGTADRLIRYLTVMSIVAWRIYWVTLIARSEPTLPCTQFIDKDEWQVLYAKVNNAKALPTTTPTIAEAVRWIAQLGGFLARKGDGEPGVISIWRGWKRLFDISEGWALARLF